MTRRPWPCIASLSIVRRESLSSTRRMESATRRYVLAKPAGRNIGAARLFFDVGNRFRELGDVGPHAILLRNRGEPLLLNQRTLRRIAHIDELGVERIDLVLQRVGKRLAALEPVARARETIAPV